MNIPKMPKHSVGEVVIIYEEFAEIKRAIIINQIIIKKNEIAYKGKLAFYGDENNITFYDREEFDYSDGREPAYYIIATIGTYNEF